MAGQSVEMLLLTLCFRILLIPPSGSTGMAALILSDGMRCIVAVSHRSGPFLPGSRRMLARSFGAGGRTRGRSPLPDPLAGSLATGAKEAGRFLLCRGPGVTAWWRL